MKTKLMRGLWLLMLVFGTVPTASTQDVAVKTNLLADGFANVNAGIEVGLAPRWTLDLTGSYNAWPVNGHKWKHWAAQPEARYWFCDRFAGHFLGIHALGGQYNFANIKNDVSFLGSDFSPLTDYRFEGWAAGGGIAYGYAWILGRHWNFELEIGFGYLYTEYDQYRCEECGRRVAADQPHHYVGPTKAAVNLVYIF